MLKVPLKRAVLLRQFQATHASQTFTGAIVPQGPFDLPWREANEYWWQGPHQEPLSGWSM